MRTSIFHMGWDKGIKAKESLLRHPHQDPLFLEQFKVIRAKINDSLEKDGNRALAVTSSIADEGKTVICVNLALNIASTGGKKVLLVDTDIRKSDFVRVMNLNPSPGLSDYLSGNAKANEIFRNSQVPDLHVIPAGSETPSPGDLLGGEKFRLLLKSARDIFDVILLDTPPVIPVADTLSLRDQVDRFLLVYRAGFTPFPMFRHTVEEIGEQRILGVVINRVKPQKDKYYKQYYGKYYRK